MMNFHAQPSGLIKQWEQRRMVLVVILFRIFENHFCFVVAICNLEHAVDAIFPLP